MKKLFVLGLVTLSFAACKKHDSDRHCWTCHNTKTWTDDRLVSTTTTDTVKLCDMTPDEIHVYEDRYNTRQLLDTVYSDRHCFEEPDKEPVSFDK